MYAKNLGLHLPVSYETIFFCCQNGFPTLFSHVSLYMRYRDMLTQRYTTPHTGWSKKRYPNFIFAITSVNGHRF